LDAAQGNAKGVRSPRRSTPPRRSLVPLAPTAVGVVYGDIGTSPLYTMRECFVVELGVQVEL
jgi:KUP system potassium uptake protein